MTGKRRAGRDPLPPPPPPDPPVQRPAAPPAQPAQPAHPAHPMHPARPAETAPFVVTRPPDRRELRAQRRRQRRRRIGAAGVAGIIAAAVIAAIAVGFGVHKVTSGSSEPDRTQSTVLLSVLGSDGSAVEGALLAHDSEAKRGVELLLPSRVIAEVCGFGSQPFGRVLRLPGGEQLARESVSSMLGGVTVDGSWTLTTDDLAHLVDRVGGVMVDVDTNVILNQNGRRVLVLSEGPGQHLAGPRAVTYATYNAPGEDSTGNLPRLQAVLDALAASLPTDQDAAARILGAGGRRTASTLGADKLAGLLVGLAADNRANAVLPSVLPVVKIDSGGEASFRVDGDATQQLVSSNLAESLPASANGPRAKVLIQNGVGTPGLVASACRRIVKAGYSVVGSGNASSFGFPTSKVLVFDSSVASARLGDRIARVLKLSPDDVAISNQGQNVADVIVILGKDFRP